MGIARLQAVTVVYYYRITVIPVPACLNDLTGRGGIYRSSVGAAQVNRAVTAAVAEIGADLPYSVRQREYKSGNGYLCSGCSRCGAALCSDLYNAGYRLGNDFLADSGTLGLLAVYKRYAFPCSLYSVLTLGYNI